MSDGKRVVWTTKSVNEVKKKLDDGFIIPPSENPFFEKTPGLRKSNVSFSYSNEEIDEYTKCKLDIRYFANNYCFIKSEDGSFKVMSLRDYQYDILNLYDKNKFSILMASRQVGKTVVASIYILHYMLFNNTKNVLLAANILDTSKEVLDKIKTIYSYLPFFLQQGIDVWNVSQIKFENGCRAKAFAMTKNASIGQTGDLVYVDEFAHIASNIADKFYKSIFPTLTNIENSKMIITSTPNGYNLFHKLLTESQLEPTDPNKNSFESLTVYWHAVPGRNVTYIKLNPYLFPQFKIDENMIFEQCKKLYNPDNRVSSNKIPIVQLKYDPNNGRPWIHIQNSEKLTYEYILETTKFINKDGDEVYPTQVADGISTWKMDTTKDIGGKDNFEQEYGLKFAAGTTSVLSESTIERLKLNKKNFEHFHFDLFKRLKWDWSGLKFVEDFNEDVRKNLYVMMSIDISEGLGQDYSVINIFKLDYKSMDLIEEQKESYQTLSDFFQLLQFGMFRSNIVSHAQLAEMAYLLIYEFFDPEKVKVVVEYNNDGKTFLSEIKNVFERDNEYSGFPILNFKHRVDSVETSKGLKVGPSKNRYVKDYQERMENQEFVIYHDTNINECATFISHTTPSGNTVYKGDGANDDTTMTLVNMSQGWKNSGFKELIDEFHENNGREVIKNIINNILSKEVKVGTDYNSFFKGINNKRRTGGKIDAINLL